MKWRYILVGLGILSVLSIYSNNNQSTSTLEVEQYQTRKTFQTKSTEQKPPTTTTDASSDKIDVGNVPLSNDNTYINSEGEQVHSPAYAPSRPAGASAQCEDGIYSFSHSRRGTCSHHGGVAEWY